MKRFYHSEQNEFRNKLVLMGQKAVEIVTKACLAFHEKDPEIAQAVIEADEGINQLEQEIDAEAIRYISLRSPVATELRLFLLGTKVGNDLERVGDEAKGIARRIIRISRGKRIDLALDFPEMMDLCIQMMRDAISCFLDGDLEKAAEIVKRDRMVDEYLFSIHGGIKQFIQRNPGETSEALELLFIAKSLERIADHAANLAEEVIFLVEGHDVRHSTGVHHSRGEGE